MNKLVTEVAELLKEKSLTLATAESCTGGLVGHLFVSLPGASDFFAGGVISYSNSAKVKLLEVKEDTLSDAGAVSEEVARQMSQGVRDKLDSDISVSITGIAGPDGGSEEKPVGTVWFAVADTLGVEAVKYQFSGNREQIRNNSAYTAVNLIKCRLLEFPFAQQPPVEQT